MPDRAHLDVAQLNIGRLTEQEADDTIVASRRMLHCALVTIDNHDAASLRLRMSLHPNHNVIRTCDTFDNNGAAAVLGSVICTAYKGAIMRLGLNLVYSGARISDEVRRAEHAEQLGYDSVWASEAWGADAVTLLAWVAARTARVNVGSAILQIPARSPAITAMTAVTLNELSEGRFILGLGMSGPQVAEGWHASAYGKPLARTREFVSIVRRIIARDGPVAHHGAHYNMPATGPGTTGLGRPLQLMIHPSHPTPIYLAAIGPKNVALAAEIADGWIPTMFSPFRAPDVFGDALSAGFAAAAESGKRDGFDIAPIVPAAVTDDPEKARHAIRPSLALYIGGMGSRDQNFYNNLACRYGFEDAAHQIQELYLGGDKVAAARLVPDDLIDEVSLIGSAEMIKDRLSAWSAAGVTALNLTIRDETTLRTLPELVA